MNQASPGITMYVVVFSAIVASTMAAASLREEKNQLREAKENYKTQMMFQGQYPKEAAELKRDLEKEKARIKREFNTSEGSAVFLASEPASQEPEEEKNQLREAEGELQN